ncbi:MAG: DUF3526 domain-containing protein, partial [Candidatus Zixiibacteriota bacterium]
VDDLVKKLDAYMDSLNDVRDVKAQALSKRLNEDLQNRQRTQERLAFSLARVSPATSLSLATSHLAGTSLRLKNRFADQVRTYQQSFGNFIKEKTGMNTGGFIKIRKSTACGGGGGDTDDAPKPVNPDELPKPVIGAMTLAESIEPALTDIGLLIVYNLLFFAGAFVAFMRYDVR